MSKARGLADLGNAYNDGALSNRNLIINGAMQVAQRGTSFSSSSYYSMDRWFVWEMASSQSSDVPSGERFVNSLQATIVSQASGSFTAIEQKFENEKLVAGQQLTFSFWVKGSASGTVVVRSFSQSNNIGFGHTAVSVTTDWQRVSATFTVPTLGGSASDWCAFGIDFNVNNVAGISYSGSGVSEPTYTGTINITGVQLEVGDTATPFEHRSYGQELALCQRYYQVGRFTSYSDGATQMATYHSYIQEMRSSPTVTRTGNAASSSEAGTAISNANTNSFYAFNASTYVGGAYNLDAEL